MEHVRRSRVLFVALVMVAAMLAVGGPVTAEADSAGAPTDGASDADGRRTSPEVGAVSMPDRYERAADNNNALELRRTRGSSAAPARSPGIATLTTVAGVDGVSCAFTSVDDAITAAPAGSTIYIKPGVYPAPVANVDYNIDKDLDLVKGNSQCQPTTGGSSTTVVLSLNAGSTLDAVLEVFNGAEVRLDRITVEGGNSAEGTVIVLANSIVTLDDAVVRNGHNPSATIGGGGVRVDPSGRLAATNGSQIENNSAVLGGGVYADDATVAVTGSNNVELNNASDDGGGIYGTGGASILMDGGADVLDNTAAGNGGGLYLDSSSAVVSGAGTTVGHNEATLGGGVFASSGSIATLRATASVQTNTADFGGGFYGLGAGTTVRFLQGTVAGNTVSNNGAGIVVTQSAFADVNERSIILGNTAAGFGGGIAVFTPASLDADGGSPYLPVRILGNTAGGDGGGIWATGKVDLDAVHLQSNSATTEGGGLYATGTVNITENFSCRLSTLAFEEYCNEFRGNTSGTLGGAIYSSGGHITAVQVGFIDNEADGGAVIMAVGASVVDIRASVAILNTETVAGGDGLVTAQGTSSLKLIGLTFADNNETFLDTDGSATATVSRVLTTTGTLGLVATPAGTCNVSAVPANLPDLTMADPQFVTKEKSDYSLDEDSEAVDACNQAGGHDADSRDTVVRDGNGVASATEFDIGGLEAPTPK